MSTRRSSARTRPRSRSRARPRSPTSAPLPEHASEVVARREVATFGDPDPPPSREGVKRVLVFLNEVAGGRKLLTACRELADGGAEYFGVVAPQNLPIVGQLVDVEERRRRRAEPGGRHPVGAQRVRDLLRGRGDGPRAGPRARRRGARDAARLHPALLPLRNPLRLHAQGPRRVGEGPLRPGRAHPGSGRRRRGALGPHPHPGRGHPDGEQQGPRRPAPGARQGEAPPLHLHLPALGRDQPRARSPLVSPRRSRRCIATRSTRPGSR